MTNWHHLNYDELAIRSSCTRSRDNLSSFKKKSVKQTFLWIILRMDSDELHDLQLSAFVTANDTLDRNRKLHSSSADVKVVKCLFLVG